MRTITKAALALGFVGAMAVGNPTPTRAHGFYVSGPGVYVQIHRRHRHHGYYQAPNAYYGGQHYYNRQYGCPPHWQWNSYYGKCTSNYR